MNRTLLMSAIASVLAVGGFFGIIELLKLIVITFF